MKTLRKILAAAAIAGFALVTVPASASFRAEDKPACGCKHKAGEKCDCKKDCDKCPKNKDGNCPHKKEGGCPHKK